MFEENPFADFVELPDDGRAQDELWYSNLLCGVLRGSLEMVEILHHNAITNGMIMPFPNALSSESSSHVLFLEADAYLFFRCKCKSRLTSSVMSFAAMTVLK